jgi:hypothetical protein
VPDNVPSVLPSKNGKKDHTGKTQNTDYRPHDDVDGDGGCVVVSGFAVVAGIAITAADVREQRRADQTAPPGKPDPAGVTGAAAVRTLGIFSTPRPPATTGPLFDFLVLIIIVIPPTAPWAVLIESRQQG